MEHLRMKYEDQDLPKTDLKHEPTSNPAVKIKMEDIELVEIRTVGNTSNGRCLETRGMKYEDQDLPKTDLKHEPTSNPAVKNKMEDIELVEIRTVGNTSNGRCLETRGMKYEDQDFAESDLEHEPTSNIAEKNKAEEDMEHLEIRTVRNTSNESSLEALEEHLDSENNTLPVNGGLSFHLGQDVDDVVASPDDLPRPSGDCSDDSENLIEEVEEPQASSPPLSNEDLSVLKCPVCTEPYDAKFCEELLLICNHTFCNNCIKTMVRNSNLNMMTCPVCQQMTQVMELEIPSLREQMLNADATTDQVEYTFPDLIIRRPGFRGTLEYRFRRHLQTGYLPPCVWYPQRLVNWLNALQCRCSSLYYCALVFLVFPEVFCIISVLLTIFISLLVVYFNQQSQL